jgi:hypothetical protein
MASFGVGGEFGQGGKYDNGERFDLRLPYADQGWVDESANTSGSWFSRLGSGAVNAQKQKETGSVKGRKGAKPRGKSAKEEEKPRKTSDYWKFFG